MGLAGHWEFAADKSLVARKGPNFSIVRATVRNIINASGLVEEIASGQAGFDHDPVTFASLGLIMENEATNEALYARDCTQTQWVKTNMTPVKDETGEDGVANSCSSLLATAGNATCIQAITLASSARTGTCSIKRLIGTGDVDITIDNGATWATVSINSLTFTRFDVTQTLANPSIGVRLVTSGDKIAIDFQGLESGTVPSSRIATLGSSVKRNKEHLVATGLDSIWNAVEGTIYTRVAPLHDTIKTCQPVNMSDNSNSDYVNLTLRNTLGLQMNVYETSAMQANLDMTSVLSGGVFNESAMAMKANDFEHYVDGARKGTGDQSGNMPLGIDTFYINSRADSGGSRGNFHLSAIRYYDTHLGQQGSEDLSNGIFPSEGLTFVRDLARDLARPLARDLAG